MKKNADQPAYPHTIDYKTTGKGYPITTIIGGLTKREKAALMAMQGIISNADTMREITKVVGVRCDADDFYYAIKNVAYAYADAMLEEGERDGKH